MVLPHPREIVGVNQIGHQIGGERGELLRAVADRLGAAAVHEQVSAGLEIVDVEDAREDVHDLVDQTVALAAGDLGFLAVRHVAMRAEEAGRVAGGVALDLDEHLHPADRAVVGADDAVLGLVLRPVSRDRIEKSFLGAAAILGMDPVHPGVMRLVDGLRPQPMQHQILRRTVVQELAIDHVDFVAAERLSLCARLSSASRRRSLASALRGCRGSHP